MRSARSERILLIVLLAIPLAVAFLGWPAFVRWAVGPSPQPTPAVAGARATAAPVAAAPTARSTPTVASRATATAVVAATTAPTAIPTTVAAAQPAVDSTPPPKPAAQSQNLSTPVAGAEGPRAAVEDFYARVAAHDFEAAASLWTPHMRAAFPPAENIDQRFSRT